MVIMAAGKGENGKREFVNVIIYWLYFYTLQSGFAYYLKTKKHQYSSRLDGS